MTDSSEILMNLSLHDVPKCVRPGCDKCSNLQACGACGVALYCSKDCQKKNWKAHKEICKKVAPYKSLAENLGVALKKTLCKMSFDLPPIEAEYRNVYCDKDVDSLFQNMFITDGLDATRKMLKTNIENLFGEESEQDILKRWQEISPALFIFLENAQVGDIFEAKEYRPYLPDAPQQFRNSPMQERCGVRNGDVVIDIGFVDFGVIFEAVGQIKPYGKKVKVFGFDAEPFCVAKSCVMIRMIKNPETRTRSVVEVWMSSLWSEATFTAFMDAVSSLLLNDHDKLDSKVRLILEFWKNVPRMTSEDAVKIQLKGALNNHDCRFAIDCCQIAAERDRVDYLRYYLTKDLYMDSSTVLGSVVMCSTSDELGIKQGYEDGMQAVPPRVYMRSDPDFRPNSGLFDRTRHYFETNMRKLMHLLRTGTLEFTPKIGKVSLDNMGLLQELRYKRAEMIHWSNVVDYLNPAEFHLIARSISGPDTVHVAHSCNWTTRVYGTDVYDINEKYRLQFFSNGLLFMENSFALIDGFASPHIQHYRNLCEITLSRRCIKPFFRYFFKNQQVNCGCFNGTTPLKTLLSPFSRRVATAFFTFAYSEAGIRFGADNYDYLND